MAYNSENQNKATGKDITDIVIYSGDEAILKMSGRMGAYYLDLPGTKAVVVTNDPDLLEELQTVLDGFYEKQEENP